MSEHPSSDPALVGESILQRLTNRWWKVAVLGLIFAATVGSIYSASRVYEVDAASESTRPSAAEPEAVADPMKQSCDDPTLRETARSALLNDDETRENATLALPSEVPASQRSAQAEAWQNLSTSEREYQWCLRSLQESPAD